jgi:hypothetical protein
MDQLHALDIRYNHQEINRSSSRANILKDPLVAHTKNRQNADKGKEIKKIKNKKCGLCKEKGHTKHTCLLSNINTMDNNIQISNSTLQLISEQDMSFYPPMYNTIPYDISVCATMMGKPVIHNRNRCIGKLMTMNFKLHMHTNINIYWGIHGNFLRRNIIQ